MFASWQHKVSRSLFFWERGGEVDNRWSRRGWGEAERGRCIGRKLAGCKGVLTGDIDRGVYAGGVWSGLWKSSWTPVECALIPLSWTIGGLNTSPARKHRVWGASTSLNYNLNTRVRESFFAFFSVFKCAFLCTFDGLCQYLFPRLLLVYVSVCLQYAFQRMCRHKLWDKCSKTTS